MKVSTRLVLGFGAVVALFVGLTVHHVSTLYDLSLTNLRVADTGRRHHLAATQLPVWLAELEELARKYAVTGDRAYVDKFDEYVELFRESLGQLAGEDPGDEVAERVERLTATWRGYEPRLRPGARAGARGFPRAGSGPWPEGRAPPVIAWIGTLRTETAATARALRAEMDERAAASAADARNAERLSWFVGGGALLVVLLVAGAVVASIYRELRRLTDGTRRIADGDFSVRLRCHRDDEFRPLVQHFNAMATRLAELDEMKRAFLSRITHDLKSPLASIQEALAVLDDDLCGTLDERQRRMVRLSRENGARLSRMIGKILVLARMEEDPGDIDRERGDLREVVRRATGDVEARAAARGVELRTALPDRPLVAAFDVDLLRQLLDNLLENALRFTPAGGRIRVRLDEADGNAVEAWDHVPGFGDVADRHGRLLLEVADSGPGVGDGEASRIFERFERGTDAGNGDGMGLGLTICREVARAHGGVIWVDDAPEGGACFRVLLPRLADVEGERVRATPDVAVAHAQVPATGDPLMRPSAGHGPGRLAGTSLPRVGGT